ncbi:MAG: MerR family transcriptional regulator [Actinomycetota bacterium]|nr:MerR family transcriptional regulator [Actinomycetota bacterium]
MTASASARARLSIGDVLAALRPDFPDVTISKIRYLESEGLVEPSRTPSGYRKFSPADVERLRYILLRQRDSYYPLKRIRAELADLDRGLQPGEGGTPRPPRVVLADDGYPPADAFGPDGRELRLTREELCESAEIDAGLLSQLEQFGLVTSRTSQGMYDGAALIVAKTAGELAGFGVEPRHLRAFKTAADREIGLFEQVVAPVSRSREPGARARADETVRQLAALSVRLHTTLVKRGLRGGG